MRAVQRKHFAAVTWRRGAYEMYTDQRHSRAHQWRFDGGAVVVASSSPQAVSLPFPVPANVDPQEGFVAALLSRHMLFFLSCAAQSGFVVDRHEDHAIGAMGKDAQGKVVMLKLVLHPRVSFGGARQARPAEPDAPHRRAHQHGILANAVKWVVSIDAAP